MFRSPHRFASFVLTAGLIIATAVTAEAQQMTGAIFTTESTCTTVNGNTIYTAQTDVYLNGGPDRVGGPFGVAAGLPDGSYYVQITDPSGSVLLGTSVGSALPQAVTVVGGAFQSCYQLWAILVKGSNPLETGYDQTPNEGGVYKVWVSSTPEFTESLSKTDNFKVKTPDVSGQGTLDVVKFYDANANGAFDIEETITGWIVSVTHPTHGAEVFTRTTPATLTLAPGTYTATEQMPVETNWRATTGLSQAATVSSGARTTVRFGNVCLGAGGGHTLGFWSNKNGEKYAATRMAALSSYNLVSENGAAFDPASYKQFRTWLLDGRAVNMSYMLSVQLSAMVLNRDSGSVLNDALVEAPGTPSGLLGNGYVRISALIADANAFLAAYPVTLDGSPMRAQGEAIKNALDNANNNLNFVQARPCVFSFAQ
jgi:hypothetical protein